MTLHRDVLKLEQELLTEGTTFTEDRVRAIVASWIVTFDQVSGELLSALDELTAANLNGTVTRGMMMRNRRLREALRAVEDALDLLEERSLFTMSEGLHTQLSATVDKAMQMVAAQLPAEITSGVTTAVATTVVGASPEQVTAMVERTIERMTSRTRELSREAKRSIRRELLRSITVGDNPRVAARRAVAKIEGVFEGGLGRAMTIARTEQLDAYRAAGQMVEDANSDVIAGWTWVAHLGPRTCPACLAMHGREFATDVPGPMGHQNCRCSRVPRTKTWAELGFRNVRERKPLLQDREEFFNSLPQADQVEILGQAKWDAWKRGDYPMDAWVTRKKNNGWRDSYVTTSAPKAA